MTTATATRNALNLASLNRQEKVRLIDANGDTWILQRHTKHTSFRNYIRGYRVQSTNPTWIRQQGSDYSFLDRIGRTITEGASYYIGGFELQVKEIRSHRVKRVP